VANTTNRADLGRCRERSDYHQGGGEPGQADRARQLVLTSRARLGSHARGRLLRVHRERALVRRVARGDRLAAASGSALSPAAGLRSAASGPARMGRRPSFQAAVPRAPHRPPPPRRRGRAQAAGRPGVLPGARPDPPAVGAVAGRGTGRRPVRGAVEDPSRAGRRDLGGRYRHRAVRRLRRPAPGRPARTRVGRTPPAELGPAVGRRAARARHRARGGGPRGPRDAAGAAHHGDPRRAGPRQRERAGLDGASGRSPQPVQRADRAPSPVHLGPGRPRRVQGDQERARRHRQRRRAGGRGRRARSLHAPARIFHRRHRAARDGPGVGPRGHRARRAGQPSRSG